MANERPHTGIEPRNRWWIVACLGVLAWLAPPPCQAESIRVTLLQINDVYELQARPGTPGGLARVAGLRAKLEQENPGHTFTILAGDALSPSALGMLNVDGEKLAGRQMVASLRALGVDFATFGNHEFDITGDQFLARLRESGSREETSGTAEMRRMYWFSDNVTDQAGNPFPGVTRELVLQVLGESGATLRIGVIGVTTSQNDPDYADFKNPVETARALASKWHENKTCDVIIAVTHLTIEEDERLALAAPEISLILGGHEHEHSYTHRPGLAHPPIAKADANVRTVYVHDLLYDTQSHQLALSSRLEPVLPTLAEEPATARVVNDWMQRGLAAFEAQYKYKAADPVFVSPHDLEGRDGLVRSTPTNLTKLVCASMLEAAGPSTDAVVLNSGTIRIDDVIPAGPVTYYDLHQILPYDGDIMTGQVRGDLLKKILDRGAAIPQDGGFLQTANIGGNTRQGWTVKGAPLDASTYYNIATTAHFTGGVLKKFTDLELDKTSLIRERKTLMDQRVALIQYLKTNPKVEPPASHPNFVKEPIPHEPIILTLP